MSIDEKNKIIEEYILNISHQVNSQYNNIIDDDKISKAIDMFKDSDEDLETEIIPKINKLVQEIIDNYCEFKEQLEEIMKLNQQEQFDELATLDLYTDKNGIFLSQQQIDLLMITELQSKEHIKDYVEKCSQFPYKTVEEIIEDYDSISLEESKRILYKKYQDSIIDYISNFQMSDIEKARIKLERLGIENEELKMCLSQVSNGKINETFVYLGQKYGNDFIKRFNRSMNEDFDNVKSVSYDEMKSLSNLIQRDNSIDTIIMATGTFNNSVYSSLDGIYFDPYFVNKALQYCAKHDIHMRYHTLFDQGRVESIISKYIKLNGRNIEQMTAEEINILKSHKDEILAESKLFVETSMRYIEKNNIKLSDGTMLINEIEIFNELVERNKSDKNSSYEMIWEKYLGITTKELVSCFDDIKKPNGVEFMYNETTLTESPFKRQKVESVLDEIINENPNLIDRFGDQMHLSDEDVMTDEGKKNLKETAQLIKRIQDKKIYVDGKEKHIKTECTEHDFHFSKSFLENVDKLKQNRINVDLWKIKRAMQDYISKTYTSNGVNFERSTYWSLFGKNDHNLVRTNKSIVKENIERKKQGISEKQPIETMYAGMIRDGNTFDNVKSLKNNKSTKIELQQQVKNNGISKITAVKGPEVKSISFKKRTEGEIKTANLIKEKNMAIKQQKEQQRNLEKPKVKTLTKSNDSGNSPSSGFANTLILSLIVSFVSGALFMVIYMLIRR